VSGAKTSRTPRRGDAASQPLYPKLPVGRRGHDGPTDSEVKSHQRERLHGAMVRAVTVYGYRRTTVRQLSALAGVSTRTLYDLFSDGKEECLLSAYDAQMRHLARRVALAYVSEPHRARRFASALETFLSLVRDDPAAAQLMFVEVFAASSGALERAEHTQRLFEEMISLNLRQTAGGVPPPLVVKGVVAGIARVARMRVLEDRAGELPALTGELLDWLLSYRSSAAARLVQLGSIGGRARAAHGALSASSSSQGAPARGAQERERVFDAVVHLAARDGYAALSVGGLAAAAGISRRRCEAHFEDAKSCFLAAIEDRTYRLLADARTVGTAGCDDWAESLHRALAEFCAYLVADPAFARAAFVELLGAGPEGVRVRETLMACAADHFSASAPDGQRPSALAAEASVGAVWGIVHQHVARGATARLPDIAPLLSFVLLAPAIGEQAAVQAIRTEHGRMRAAATAAA
jgi:AcrR family transcriptional regulator